MTQNYIITPQLCNFSFTLILVFTQPHCNQSFSFYTACYSSSSTPCPQNPPAWDKSVRSLAWPRWVSTHWSLLPSLAKHSFLPSSSPENFLSNSEWHVLTIHPTSCYICPFSELYLYFEYLCPSCLLVGQLSHPAGECSLISLPVHITLYLKQRLCTFYSDFLCIFGMGTYYTVFSPIIIFSLLI